MMIKPGDWEVKNELQKIAEKLMDLKLQKTETNEIFFLELWKFPDNSVPWGETKIGSS